MAATSSNKLRLEYLDAKDLNVNPSNWRLHPQEQLDAINSTIGEVGWAGALLYNEKTKRLLDGHARRDLFAKKGGKVPVLIGSWDEDTEKKILASLDPLASMAETDRQSLEQLLSEINPDGTSLDELFTDIGESYGSAFASSLVKVSDLKFHERNYRQHPDDQLEHLIRSIAEHGFYRNVVISRDNTVLAGQGVVQAARKMGRKKIPVIRLDLDSNEPRALKVMTSDNEIGRLGEVDDRALTELLKDIMELDSLDGTGFDEHRLAALTYVTRPEHEIKDFNEAAEWVGLPSYTPTEQPLRVVVSFENEEKRDEFLKMIGATVIHKKSSGAGSSKTWSIWWPERKKQDLASLRFDFGD